MSKRKHPISAVNVHHQAQDRLVYGGLLGVNAIAVFQMLGVEILDGWLHLAVFLSAIALPLLAFLVVLLTIEDQFKHVITSWPVRTVKMLSPLISFAAIDAVFWHFLPLAGLGFLLVSGIATVAFMVYYDFLNKLDNAEAEEDLSVQEA